jgi:hypothetical protein
MKWLAIVFVVLTSGCWLGDRFQSRLVTNHDMQNTPEMDLAGIGTAPIRDMATPPDLVPNPSITDMAMKGPDLVSVTVTLAGTGMGSVAGGGVNCSNSGGATTCSVNVNRGTHVTLTATPAAGSDFASWSGVGCTGGAGSCSFTASADMNPVTASFSPSVVQGKVTFTLTMRNFGPGTGSITSTPSGLSCNTNGCTSTAQFNTGTTVTITATPGSATLFNFGGDCIGQSCTLATSVNHSVTATFTGYNYVFVTSTGSSAAFGGLSGGDNICKTRAQAAGLPGSYVAWLSTSTVNASSRFGSARGWIRPDGLPFADSINSLTQQKQVFYPPTDNEFGNPTYANAWTATAADGTFTNSGSCGDWTNQTGGAILGTSEAGSGVWTYGGGGSCQNTGALYCFGVDLSSPLSFTPATGRIAFLSKGTFSPAGGVAAADSLCASEASAASLTGTFLAALSTDTTAWGTRFNTTTGAPWVRVDGVALAAKAANYIGGGILASLNVSADGTIWWGGTSNEGVWTGSKDPNKTAVNPATDSCNNWLNATSSDTAYTGGPQYAYHVNGYGAFGWGAPAASCDVPKHIYCLQK